MTETEFDEIKAAYNDLMWNQPPGDRCREYGDPCVIIFLLDKVPRLLKAMGEMIEDTIVRFDSTEFFASDASADMAKFLAGYEDALHSRVRLSDDIIKDHIQQQIGDPEFLCGLLAGNDSRHMVEG